MSERKKSPMSGRRQSAAQKAAASANLAKGRNAKKKIAEQAYEEGRDSAPVRWAKLLDGTITVRDLDDDEIAKMRVKQKDGTFGPGRRLPSHLAIAFQQEGIRRANDMFRTAAPQAVKRLLEIAADPDTRDGDAIRALSVVLDRALGKTPETIRVEQGSLFEEFLKGAGDVDLDRDMGDVAKAAQDIVDNA